MSTPSPLSPESPEVLLQLFWQRLGHTPSSGDPLSRQQRDAARRIVAAVGPTTDAVTLAATYADEFSQDLPQLADALGHPSAAIQALTPQALTGGALLAATAVGLGQSRQDAGDLAGAEHAYRWATQQFHVLGEPQGQTESLALVLLGRVLEMQERLNEAEQCLSGGLGS